MKKICKNCGSVVEFILLTNLQSLIIAKGHQDWTDDYYNNFVEIFLANIEDKNIREMAIAITERCIELEKRCNHNNKLKNELFNEINILKEQIRKIPYLMHENPLKEAEAANEVTDPVRRLRALYGALR